MLCLRRPKTSTLQRVLVREAQAQPSYDEVGQTAAPRLPPGYRHDKIVADLGAGREVYERCAQHLRRWGLQQQVGFDVFPTDEVVRADQTVLLSLRFGPACFVASARVIYLVDEPDRTGFAYGTLPTHPEQGEEYFGVTIDDADHVRFETWAFSRPRALAARIGSPVTRRLQLAAFARYVRAMQETARNV